MTMRENIAREVAGLHLNGPLKPPAKPSAAAYRVADAVLAVLREPTQEMLEAADSMIAETIWQAMIDAAKDAE